MNNPSDSDPLLQKVELKIKSSQGAMAGLTLRAVLGGMFFLVIPVLIEQGGAPGIGMGVVSFLTQIVGIGEDAMRTGISL